MEESEDILCVEPRRIIHRFIPDIHQHFLNAVDQGQYESEDDDGQSPQAPSGESEHTARPDYAGPQVVGCPPGSAELRGPLAAGERGDGRGGGAVDVCGACGGPLDDKIRVLDGKRGCLRCWTWAGERGRCLSR